MYYHMQQYLDGPVVLERDESHFKMVTFVKASRYDWQNYDLRHEVDIWGGHMRYGWWNQKKNR